MSPGKLDQRSATLTANTSLVLVAGWGIWRPSRKENRREPAPDRFSLLVAEPVLRRHRLVVVAAPGSSSSRAPTAARSIAVARRKSSTACRSSAEANQFADERAVSLEPDCGG